MGVPGPVASGTTAYAFVVAGLCVGAGVLRGAGVVKKETMSIALVCFVVGGVCTWLFWCVPRVAARNRPCPAHTRPSPLPSLLPRLCAWMQQWHPLIVPEAH